MQANENKSNNGWAAYCRRLLICRQSLSEPVSNEGPFAIASHMTKDEGAQRQELR